MEVWGGFTFPQAIPGPSYCSGKLFRLQKPSEPYVGGPEAHLKCPVDPGSRRQSWVVGLPSSHWPVLVVSRMPWPSRIFRRCSSWAGLSAEATPRPQSLPKSSLLWIP